MKILAVLFFIVGVSTGSWAQKNLTLKESSDTLLPVDLNGVKVMSWFSDCGEWGGHKEEFVITKSSNDAGYCSFKMYSVDCDYMTKEGLVQKLVKDTTFALDDKKVLSLNEYFQKMLLAKLSYKRPIGNAANYYALYNSDSTLRIEFSDARRNIDNYLKLKKDLGVLSFR